MAGIFDLHILQAMEQGWSDIKNDDTAWGELFEGIDSSITTEWITELRSTDIDFAAAFRPDNTELPAVFVTLDSDELEYQSLGYFIDETRADLSASTTSTAKLDGFLSRETAGIHIYAGNPEILRAIYVLLKGLVLSSLPWFLENAGYHEINFRGGSDIRPDRELFPEELGVFMRTMRWSAVSTSRVGTTSIQHKPFAVHSSDVKFDGTNDGGVSGTENI